jgi:hypothetical protein
MKRVALSVFLVALSSTTFAADETSRCVLPAGVKDTVRLADFPASLRKSMPGLGDSNASFRTDAVVGNNDLPSAHLIHAFWRGPRWVVLYSTGGFANPRFVMTLDVPEKGMELNRLSNKAVYPDGPCLAIGAGFAEKAKAYP